MTFQDDGQKRGGKQEHRKRQHDQLIGFDLRSPCQNEITHQESRISADASDATKTNFMQPELTGKISVSPARLNHFMHVLDDETRLAANRARRRGI
jgi:hypothetical protein